MREREERGRGRGGGKRGRGRGEGRESRDAFYDLVSGLTYCHFERILLVRSKLLSPMHASVGELGFSF